MTGVILCILVTISWFRNQEDVESNRRQKIELTGRFTSQQFEVAIENNFRTLRNLKARIEETEGFYFNYWEFDANRIIDQASSFKFVEYIDSSLVIRRITPLEGNEAAVNLDISKLSYRKEDWETVKQDSVINVTHWLKLVQGGDAFLIDAPLFYRNEFHGTITAGMDFRMQFDQIMGATNEYFIEMKDERGTVFYTYQPYDATQSLDEYSYKQTIEVTDSEETYWSFTMIPTEHFIDEKAALTDQLNLYLGLLLSLLSSVAIYFGLQSVESEKKQKEANEKLRALIEAAPIAIFVIDEQGKVVDFWNKAAEDILGWSRSEVMGKFMPQTENHREEYAELIRKLNNGEQIKDYELVRTRKNGDPIYLRLNAGKLQSSLSGSGKIIALVEDITGEKAVQKQLQASLDEQQVLLLEIHHRVKNNLAIITGLIELQSHEIDNDQVNEVLIETKNRIYSIAGVHEMLYQTGDFTSISFDEYTEKLIDRITMMFEIRDREISTDLDLHTESLNINQAIPLGLVLNEMVTNSFKHAFHDKKTGHIELKLNQNGDRITGMYKDNGTGFDKTAFENSTSLGLTLIKTLFDQLNADYELKTKEGFEMHFTFDVKVKGSHSNLT